MIGVSISVVARRQRRWNPSMISSVVTWHDDTCVYGGPGWVGRIGATLAGTAPTEAAHLGRRTLVFNGTDQVLGAAFTREQPTHTILAGRFLGSTPAATALIFAGGAGQGYLARTTGEKLLAYAGTSRQGSPTAPLEDRWSVFGAHFAGALGSVYDGTITPVATGAIGTNAVAGLSIGANRAGSNFAACEVAEVLTGDFSDADLSRIFSYLRAKWSIT